MIYRALIESQYNNYQYKIKIPALDTKTYNATVCSTPGVNATLRIGDAVFVTFEKNSNDNAVILGTLYNEKNILLEKFGRRCTICNKYIN